MFEDVVSGLVDLDDDALTDRIGTLEPERRRVEAELAAAIAMADARGVDAHDGHRSMTGI
ncbi:MAG: hypothetical protein ABJH68_01755 [Ilumatobacter sp.]|uniref:hypothetical protein n=1 Tax=Ilumatobacter sp. TaxID=1967498 RepID=UPI00329A2DFA